MRTKDKITNVVILLSTLMIAFTGIIGIETTKYSLYIIVASLFVEALFISWNTKQVICFFAILVFSVFTSWQTNQNVANALIFSTSTILIIQGLNHGYSQSSWKCIKMCAYLISAVYIYTYLFNPNWTVYGQLVLFFDNPNMAGIAICAPTFILLLTAIENRGKHGNIINWILFGVFVYFIYLTQNRSSLVAVLFTTICAIVDKFSLSQKRITSSFVFTLMRFAPIIILVIYVVIYSYLPHDLTIFGKPLFSGREFSWQMAMQSFLKNPFSHQNYEYGTFNLVLDALMRYGIVAVVAYFTLINSVRIEDIKKITSVQYIAFIAFLACLFQQSFESTLISGSYSVYIWTYSLIGIAFMEDQPSNLSMYETEGN